MPIEATGKIIPAIVTPISAVSTDAGIKVVHLGAATGATTTVAAGGDMTFKVGVAGSEAVDSSIGASGVLDLSTPGTYTTVGSVVDEINSSTTGWYAVPWGSLRANLTDNRFITMAETQCHKTVISLLHDTTTVGATSTYIIGAKVTRENLLGRTDAGWYNGITLIEGIYTAAAQVAIVVVYSINLLTKVETEVWRSSTVLASETAFQFDQADWGEMPLYGNPGEALLVQVQVPNGAAYTVPRLQIKGFHQIVSGGVNRMGIIGAQ